MCLSYGTPNNIKGMIVIFGRLCFLVFVIIIHEDILRKTYFKPNRNQPAGLDVQFCFLKLPCGVGLSR